MVQVTGRAGGAKGEPAALVSPPSWVDRLTAWVERRPGPPWLYYAGAALLVYLSYVAIKWWDGGVAVGTFPVWTLLPPASTAYYVALIHYMDRLAAEALERFRPALDAPSPRVAKLEYRLTTMPARAVVLATLLGLGMSIAALVGQVWGILSFRGPTIFGSWPATVLEVTLPALTLTFFVIAVYHTVHQLRTVDLLYAEITEVDPFDQVALHAFARLTAYTVVSWIVIQYFWLSSTLTPGAFRFALGFLFTVMVLAVLAFLWPLMGIHRLLVAEKEQLQTAATARLQRCLRKFDEALERNELDQMPALEAAIANAERERDIVKKLPTWPWESGLIRNVVTAFLLPLVLWVATRLLEELFMP